MKLRITKFLKVAKTPIGLSMLDVVSNALASIILLFFVMVAIRSQPPVPERMVGIFMIDYELQAPESTPEISVFLERPGRDKVFENAVANEFLTHDIDSIPGVWGHAVVLATPGKENTHRRIFYMNPEYQEGEDKEWKAGIIYTDHDKLVEKTFQPGATLTLKAFFISKNSSFVLDTLKSKKQVLYPTQFSRTSFELPMYQIPN